MLWLGVNLRGQLKLLRVNRGAIIFKFFLIIKSAADNAVVDIVRDVTFAGIVEKRALLLLCAAEHVHVKKRSKALPKNAEKIVFSHHNLPLPKFNYENSHANTGS
ncbi:uncharacterized protein LOC126473160 isoform X2 [Schistocerca serialis cubense]|uniref:uncharacterized protein LOC126473160 isoform X2 n=1 Tax=Schistocerca serialis cubense TaxID=2023355 RepID=UPI00214F33B8|nr:uncharacterized protein LOC126473160 isoform X2 [Schistocerca serialis cubense]